MTDTMQYGPQTAEIEALLARARTLTAGAALMLSTEWYAARYALRAEAWDAVGDSVLDARRGAARGAARDAAWIAVPGAERYAVWDATLALVARDLITPAGFTQEHYDLLTRPVALVIGKVHPEDEEVQR